MRVWEGERENRVDCQGGRRSDGEAGVALQWKDWVVGDVVVVAVVVGAASYP